MGSSGVILKARNDGYVAGYKDCRKKALDFLEAEYMNSETERGSAEGEAILTIARALSGHLIETPTPTKDPNAS